MALQLEVPSRWIEEDCNGFMKPCVGSRMLYKKMKLKELLSELKAKDKEVEEDKNSLEKRFESLESKF